MKRFAVSAFLALVLTMLLTTGSVAQSRSSASSNQAPVGLTHEGRLLWDFEGLLRQSFRRDKVVSASVVRATGQLSFSCAGFCAPNAAYSTYWYAFSKHSASAFHLVAKAFEGSWGNYRRQVLIRGRSVACNANETLFLVQNRQAVSFRLECSRPPA